MMIVIGIIAATKIAVEVSAIGFMWRALAGQKSNTMIFTPLIAWYSTAATNPSFLSKGLAFTGQRSIRVGARFSF